MFDAEREGGAVSVARLEVGEQSGEGNRHFRRVGSFDVRARKVTDQIPVYVVDMSGADGSNFRISGRVCEN